MGKIRLHQRPGRLVTLFVLLWFPALTASGQPVAGCCGLRIEVRAADGPPIAAARIDVSGPGRAVSDRTDSKGNASFTLPRPGTYRLSASKDGYMGLSRGVDITVGETITVEFELQPRLLDSQSVTVKAGEDPAAPARDTASGADVRAAPERPATLREALPLIPGVIRTPEGKLVISEAAEHRNSLLVDSLDATDPATGSFGLTVPVDSVVAFDVYKSPFLAEFGRFTSGVVTVQTRGGGDTWHWELNDPTPELRILGGHLRGIRAWTPRLSFNGPLLLPRLYVSESIEYAYKRRPVRTLAFPHNEDKRESWNSLTRLDYVRSQRELLTVKLHAAPQRLMYYGLNFYNPQEVTPNFWGHEGMADLSYKMTIGGGMLESAVSFAQVTARVAGQGSAELVMTPVGNSGNYFLGQDRRAQKFEWLENWSSAPLGRDHHLKAGLSIVRARAQGAFQAQQILIAGTRQELLERIPFANAEGYRATDWETALYAHDHWTLRPSVSVDVGIRFERQQLTGMNRLAPRFGIAWSPFSRSSTVLRAGAGWFYDRVPLNVFGFSSYPERTVTSFSHEGEILSGPTTFVNTIGTADSANGPLVFGPVQPGNFLPRSTVWKVQIEQALSGVLQLRAAFWQGRARDLIVLNPVERAQIASLLLSAEGRSRYQQFELVSRVTLPHERRVFLSYVNGRAHSNLNEFPDFLGNYPVPLVRPDMYATSATNVPHRFLAWGVVPLTSSLKRASTKLFPPSLAILQLSRGWLIAPVAEYRTGFPYSRLDERQNYAGTPNVWRFPNFFSLDSRIAKNIPVGEEHAVQVSFSVFNLTNHWNPESVRWNTADAQVGEFLGQRPRRFRLDFDVLF